MNTKQNKRHYWKKAFNLVNDEHKSLVKAPSAGLNTQNVK